MIQSTNSIFTTKLTLLPSVLLLQYQPSKTRPFRIQTRSLTDLVSSLLIFTQIQCFTYIYCKRLCFPILDALQCLTFNAKGQSHIIYQGEGGKSESTGSICVLVIMKGLPDKNSQPIPGKGSSPRYREHAYKPQAFLVVVGSMQKCHGLADSFTSGFQNEKGRRQQLPLPACKTSPSPSTSSSSSTSSGTQRPGDRQ